MYYYKPDYSWGGGGGPPPEILGGPAVPTPLDCYMYQA